jgi:hypothetical protein
LKHIFFLFLETKFQKETLQAPLSQYWSYNIWQQIELGHLSYYREGANYKKKINIFPQTIHMQFAIISKLYFKDEKSVISQVFRF